MGEPTRSLNEKKSNGIMRILIGIAFGFLLGISVPAPSTLSNKERQPLNIFLPFDVEDQNSGLSTQASLNLWSSLNNKRDYSDIHRDNNNHSKIWDPINPLGSGRLPPGIVESQSDLYLRRLWGQPSEDLITKPKYLVTFTVGYEQRKNINAAVKKFSDNFTILLFHYDGRTSEWDQFEWSKQAIHISAPKQTKWWYAKRFLHPDIVASYDYIFIWDEDLGMDNFNAEEYIKMVRKHRLEISQPGIEAKRKATWRMTTKQNNSEVHKEIKERPGWCDDPHLPPCAAFVEIMAPVFSREAWGCVWYMIQNDLVHGWGLDFAFKRCVEPAHEKIGVVDAQWVVHQTVPSLGKQGQAEKGTAPWVGVRRRCRKEWIAFQKQMEAAEKAHFKAMGIDPPNQTSFLTKNRMSILHRS